MGSFLPRKRSLQRRSGKPCRPLRTKRSHAALLRNLPTVISALDTATTGPPLVCFQVWARKPRGAPPISGTE
jgi:hypothetical protein